MSQQLEFFEENVRNIVRTTHGEIAYYPAVFSAQEAGTLFKELLECVPWSKETMQMYDKLVEVPRLVAWYAQGEPLPVPLRAIRAAVQKVCAITFNGVSLNYYRDGSDSVAWHSDHNEDLVRERAVALVSFGAMRQMQFRTKGSPRRQLRCDLEPGSVLVMRGDIQSFWEHHIPKVRRPTDARISVALRTKPTTS